MAINSSIIDNPIISITNQINQYKIVLMFYNVSGLCVVALSRNLKLTTTLDRAITQNPCYVPLISNQNVR